MKIKKNWEYLWVYIISLLSFAIYPRWRIKCKLKKRLLAVINKDVNVYLFKSGRSSLYSLFKILTSKGFSEVIIPHRLCNVVEMAAITSGLEVRYYKCNKSFDLLIDSFNGESNSKPILLIATYFNRQISKKYIVERYLNRFGIDFPVIFDECQSVFDFNLYSQYNEENNKYLILSFNDKFIPGIMGGAILTNNSIDFHQIKLTIQQELYYFLYCLYNLYEYLTKKIEFDVKGEYSIGKGLKYNNVPHVISYASSLIAYGFLKKYRSISSHFSENTSVLEKRHYVNSLKPFVYHGISFSDYDKSLLLPYRGPYLINKQENLHEAISDSNGVFLINSFKFRYHEQ